MTSTRTVEGLADRQGLFSEVRRRSKDVSPGDVRPKEGPWISISRQLGSGGSVLAGRVAELLGWKSYDREIVSAIADGTHSQEILLDRFDERGVPQVDEYLTPLIVPDDPGQARYLVEMTRVIARIARQGQAVLVGRGANWFLTPSCGLRVRAFGALEARVAALAHVARLDLEEARRRCETNDASQRSFIKQGWNRDIDDPSGYDLILNPLDLGLPAAVEAVIAAARTKLAL